MKKSIFKIAIAGISLLTLGAAHAQSEQSAKIDFTGSISPVTCKIRNTDRNKRVDFGVVPPTSGFTGTTAGNVSAKGYERDFSITLEGCTTPGQSQHPSQVRVNVTGGVNSADGRLDTNNETIQIQLSQPNALTTPWDLRQASDTVTLTTAPVNMNFRAQYYIAKTPLNMGLATAQATFSMEYP